MTSHAAARSHVLIVDDQAGPRQALEYALRSKHRWWSISSASSAESARAILERPPTQLGAIDLVLTDLVLGNDKGGGIEVLSAAKRVDPFVMVILFTAQERELDRFEAYRHGAFDCVEKTAVGRSAWREISVKAAAALEFRRLALAQVENEKQLAALEPFFDPRLLEAVRHHPAALAVRQRETTLVLWRLHGFPALCHALASRPEVLQGFLYDFYNLATQAVFRHGGVLDKLSGDGVSALFCALEIAAEESVGPGHDPFDAVLAALQLRATFAKLCRKWRIQWQDTAPDLALSLSCVLHGGRCLVGNFGSARREQFTAVGPHVSFADEMRDRPRREGVDLVITETVARRVHTRCRLRELDPVEDSASLPSVRVRLFELIAARPEDVPEL